MRVDSIILLQFACGKLLSLTETKSLFAPLREHTLSFLESKDYLDSVMSLIILDSIYFIARTAFLVSLVESESPLTPLREHTLSFLESKVSLGVRILINTAWGLHLFYQSS